ncbi:MULTISPECIES: hypothetical protein [unclassified Citrobacter freundii complex]|uniref:gp53-like domain-containing protein n=1 Tax=unclassified Citrobacter freundii complex TaxID=2816438 RepID=UPI001F4124FD|nr:MULTISPECIES: hypothetical protein [unclassified Citrobacter freundii complex]
MATNNFKPFATAANANVTAQADWESLPALLSGFTAGKASSAQVNKAIRQASFIAAALAQYTANKSGLDVLDDGDLNGFIAKMSAAFGKDFQALDATLTALAGLTTGANKLPYFTGTDTASQTDLTSVGRDIIGKGTIADILTYLGLGKTDTPKFGGLKAPSITLLDGKIILTSSTDGTTLVFTVSGGPVAEIKAGSFFHKKIISAGEVLQSPKYIFRDGDIIFYSGPNNLVMQVGGKDVATLTSDSFYHVKQVAAAESLKAPKVVLRDGDVNLIGGANNLVIQVGGNDIASLTPGNNFFKGKLTAETSLQVGSTCILATDGNLTGSKWGGWLDAFMKDGMSTDGNGLWWDAFSSQLQFRVGDWNIPDAAGGAGTSVTFPKAFKNGCLMVIPIPGNGGASQQIGSQSYSASGAVLQKGASDNNPRSGKYLAIGY